MREMASNVGVASMVQKFLQGINFPANKQDIISKAQQHGADNNVTSMLQKLPDRVFQSQDDLMNEVNKMSK